MIAELRLLGLEGGADDAPAVIRTLLQVRIIADWSGTPAPLSIPAR